MAFDLAFRRENQGMGCGGRVEEEFSNEGAEMDVEVVSGWRDWPIAERLHAKNCGVRSKV